MAELAKYRRPESDELSALGPARVPAQASVAPSASALPQVSVGPFRGILGSREQAAARSQFVDDAAPVTVPAKGIRQMAGEAKNFWLYGETPGTEVAPSAPASMRGTAQAASPPAAAGAADFTAGMTPATRQAYWDKWSNNPDQSWENGGAATPGTVLSFRGAGREGSFVVPEGRSTPATWADLNPVAGGVRQSVDVLRGGNTTAENFAPAARGATAMQPDENGVYWHNAGIPEGGYQRIAPGGKNAYYDSQIETAPGQYGAFRNAQTGAVFGSMAEAERGNPAGVLAELGKADQLSADAATLPAFRGAQANKFNAEAATEDTRANAAMIAARAAETSAGAKATTDKWIQTEQVTSYDALGAPVTSKVLVNPTTGAKIDPTEYTSLAKRAYQGLDVKRRQLVDDYLGDRDADPMDILAYIQSLGR